MASTNNSTDKLKVSLEQGFLLTEGTESINCTPIPPINSPSIIQDIDTEDTTKNPTGEKQEEQGEQTEEEGQYIQPEQNPYITAVNYLEEHHIMQIFQHLTSGIVYQKPEDPLQYMVDELVRMRAKKLEDGIRFPGS
ncbi:testis-specific expressed protein 55-like [Anneissia japonica]|uniref:testis-specific expressed protein 55-like n=1 Tax=Anneissia japonica TaxID=1529436 RepID=UPI0014259C2B|nr:testis-specific expressed protein 55-like [Anneissia japonica]